MVEKGSPQVLGQIQQEFSLCNCHWHLEKRNSGSLLLMYKYCISWLGGEGKGSPVSLFTLSWLELMLSLFFFTSKLYYFIRTKQVCQRSGHGSKEIEPGLGLEMNLERMLVRRVWVRGTRHGGGCAYCLGWSDTALFLLRFSRFSKISRFSNINVSKLSVCP